MRASAAGNYDPVEADCRFHESIIAATNNRFYQPLGALVRTALSLPLSPTRSSVMLSAISRRTVRFSSRSRGRMSSAPSTSCADCFPTSQERSQRLKLCPRFPIVDRPPLRKSERRLLA
jgi:hypothetical protein